MSAFFRSNYYYSTHLLSQRKEENSSYKYKLQYQAYRICHLRSLREREGERAFENILVDIISWSWTHDKLNTRHRAIKSTRMKQPPTTKTKFQRHPPPNESPLDSCRNRFLTCWRWIICRCRCTRLSWTSCSSVYLLVLVIDVLTCNPAKAKNEPSLLLSSYGVFKSNRQRKCWFCFNMSLFLRESWWELL